MYVVGLNDYGGPDVLRLMERPDPQPARGEVRIKVRSAGVNPVDVMVRDGSLATWFADAPPPFVPGMDIAGTIDQMGESVDPTFGLAVGQNVVGVVDNFGSYGGYSAFVCLPAASVIAVPNGLAFPAAASFLMNALTARNALDALQLAPGATVLVSGAAGAVGAYTVALAASDGLCVLAVAAPTDQDFLRTIGATVVLPRGDDIARRARDTVPEGVDAVVDAAGLQRRIAPAIRQGGTLITLRSIADPYFDDGVLTVFVNVRERVTDHAAIARIGHQVADGLLTTRVAGIFPATDAAAAHRRLAEGGLRGRLILDFDDLGKPQ